MTNKKILFVIDNLGAGGAQRRLANLALLLKERGFKISILMYSNEVFYSDLLENNQIPIIKVLTETKMGRVYKIRKNIIHYHADIVISFLEVPGFIACLAKVGRKQWKLITNESSAKLSTFTLIHNRVFNVFERFSDAKVCNSQNAKEMWGNYYPQYYGKCHVIYNPIVIPEMKKKHVYKEHGILNIIVAASYQALKNVDGLIEALNLLKDDERERVHITWYGSRQVSKSNNDVYNDAVKKIEKYKLKNCITLNEACNGIYDRMHEADIVGLFSFVEGLPNAICEGMMIGRPIIMSKVSDYKVLVNGNGVVCDPKSPEDICSSIKYLIGRSSQELERMGSVSARIAEQLFSPELVIDKWINLFDTLEQLKP